MKLYGRRSWLLASVLVIVTHGLLLAEAQSSLGNGVDSRQIGNAPGIWPWQIFQTVNFTPPVLEVNATGEERALGLVFISPSDFNESIPSVKQTAPVIFTDTGDLVWNGPNTVATNFRTQTLFGKPVLTYWEGDSSAGAFIGHGYGSVVILDDSYTQIARICPQTSISQEGSVKFKCDLDLHESKITDRNTLLATGYNVTAADLSAVGGPVNGFIYDAVFFEIALDGSQNILFQWSAIEHVPVTESKQPLGKTGTNASSPYDYFHINAVDLVGSNYLVNARHTWSTYYVQPSGEIAWRVQGETGGDFGPLPPAGQFRWQHDARHHLVSNDSITISWFNNNNNWAPGTQGVGTVISLPTSAFAYRFSLPPNPSNPPVLLNYLTSKPAEFAASQGDYLWYIPGSRGHQFVGFGQLPLVKEYSSQQKGYTGLLWTGRFGFDNLVQNYRGYKSPWKATPLTKPALVVKPDAFGGNASYRTGFVSWNGATEVTSYNVYEGTTSGSLSLIDSVKKAGFETAFAVSTSSTYAQVGAVEGSKEVSRSEVIQH